MKSFIFKIAIILSKGLRYISYLGAGFTLLGSILTLIFKDDVIQVVESHQFNLQEVSLPFIIYSCLSALIKDYLTNIILMVIVFSSMIIFDTGKSLKEDSESIIWKWKIK